jgi:hypothetical protein
LAPFWIHRVSSTKRFSLHLNESLWFNRFIFDPDRNTRGRSFTKSIEDKLIKLSFTHVRELLSTQFTDDKLWFMSHAEAESRTGSKVLANAITKKIFFLLPTWGLFLHNKIREPFCTGDWFIDLNEPTPDSPLQIFGTTFVSENHLVGESFRFSNPSSNLLIKTTISVKNSSDFSMHKSMCFQFTRKIILLWKLLDR